MRTHVDLCTGIGGFSLGFIAAQLSEPVLLCDFDEKVRKLLRVRFPGIPIANDVKEIANDPTRFIHERPFILSAGYPCQPFSQSGKRKGEEDPRHIFPAIAEIVAQTRPSWCVFENVYGHISLGIDKVLGQMGSLDYATATFIVPAACFRPHKRDRLWIICKNLSDTNDQGIWSCFRGADINNERSSREGSINRGRSTSDDEWNDTTTTKDERMDVPNTDSKGLERRKFNTTIKNKESIKINTWTEGNHGKNVADTECGISKTELQRKQRVLRKEDSKGKTKGSGNRDVSERGISQTFASFRGIFDGLSGWLDEPRHIQRTTYKNEYRAERLKQLGNALLPQITYRIGLAIKEVEENK